MIELNALRKRFGPITAVDGVSLRVERGEVLGFLGPNGAGKSTTMKMLTGYLAPTSGTAVVCGHDVLKRPLDVKRAIGYLPEGAPAYPDMTPMSFLRFIAEVRKLGSKTKSRIDEVVSMVHLEGVMRQPIETLSKGYKRRVGLAQALLHDPDVLILDEPTDGLDPNQKHEVRDLIQRMGSEKAIILSTHILEEVEAVCTRAVIISRGRVVADGTPADLQARSALHNAVRLRAESPTPFEDLGSVKGVASVRPDGDRACTVLAEGGTPIAAEIGRFTRDRGWAISEMHVMVGRLDDVFRDLTTSDTAIVAGVSEATSEGGDA